MNRHYKRTLRNRKRRIQRRLDPKKVWCVQPEPMMTARNIHYEMAERSRGINCEGIGALHMMVTKIGLCEEIDRRLHLLKLHLPYHESDHVLNLAYNALRMEFRRFLHSLILVPAQIVRSGRRIIFRIITYNDWLKDLFAAWERLRCLRVT